jgi:uncharacterized protein (TIGR02117 family)
LALGALVPRPLWPAPTGRGRDAHPRPRRAHPHRHRAPLDARTRDRFAFLAPPLSRSTTPTPAGWCSAGAARAFYLETRRHGATCARPVLRALTLDASVLHADVAGTIALPAPGALALDLSDGARDRLDEAILASFAATDGRPIEGATYNGRDRFFEARGRFNLLLGCNTWTASTLRVAGLRTGWWTPLPQTLLASLRLHAP